ncbi:MAG: DUF2075 domain-containing protein [Vicinamibacterales bacterium]
MLGELTHGHSHEQLDKSQIRAWEIEIEILKEALPGLSGSLYLEFSVPRLGSRIDAVLVSGPALFPIEFKCGEQRFTRDAYNQAWDYALDLKNFHLGSHQALILPMVVATEAPRGDLDWAPAHTDGVYPPRRCSRAELGNAIRNGLSSVTGVALNAEAWGRAPYQPTPTIIEAARALYARHTVEAITRNDAGAKNLTVTSSAVEGIVERTRANNEKAIVFLTGVPGAGKTLVGLNVATQRRNSTGARAVFLSGNGPLVAVLQEALTRDEMRRIGKGERKGAVKQKVKPFIQNVHHFRDEGLRTSAAPFDHVAIFDEAQRAWNRRKTANFMKQRKGLDGFTQSEPEFLLSYLDRHEDWAVILCLVGGGQEINDGEAGIAAWCEAIESSFPHWRSYLSPELSDAEYAAASALRTLSSRSPVTTDDRLHLSTSMRSFRSEKVSAFVKAVLDCDEAGARAALADVALRYPIVVTRDLAKAKEWVRRQARGTEQFGLVASSQAQRLKPLAVDVRVSVDPIHWFLGAPSDTRSSYYLEDAATEFQVQGLEVDWACVAWDADLRLHDSGWRYHSFRGDSWTNVHNEDRRRYLLNAYRVLLTRARQGMAIFVPTGDAADPTRRPEFYDETFEYLTGLGLRTL